MKYDLCEQSKHSLDITLLSIQVEKAIFGINSDDEYNVAGHKQQGRNRGALSVGFEYICQKDDTLFFRKRK